MHMRAGGNVLNINAYVYACALYTNCAHSSAHAYHSVHVLDACISAHVPLRVRKCLCNCMHMCE